MKILLPYFFPISATESTPSASTAYLKKVLVLVSPAEDVSPGTITNCTSMAAVTALTDNTECQELFDAGMTSVKVLPLNALTGLAAAIDGHEYDFWTILVSSDFDDDDVLTISSAAVKAELKIQDILFKAKTAGTAGNSTTINYNSGGTAGAEGVSVTGSAITLTIEDGVSTATQIAAAVAGNTSANALVDCVVDSGDETDKQAIFGAAVPLAGGLAAVTEVDLGVGGFKGVVGVSSDDDDFLAAMAAKSNHCAFHTTSGNKAKNMFYAFGKLLSNLSNWQNQQFIEMPHADDVETLGDANDLFDSKISFVIEDDEFGNRLALFACGGKAIVEPYIKQNLIVDMQSKALQYVSANMPQLTKVQAALLENELKQVDDLYVTRQWIESGTVDVTIENDNFVATGALNIAEPTAMWRIFGGIQETL